MKSLWIKLILVVTCAASGNSLSFAQVPEQMNQNGEERIEIQADAETSKRLKTTYPKWKQPRLNHIGAALSRGGSPANAYLGKEDTTTLQSINGDTLILIRGTQPFSYNVLQILKTAGITLITGGILTILIIYLLIMSIILLRAFLSYKRVS